MPSLVYYNPANPKQRYLTMTVSDPNIPAGYVDSQGSDFAIPEALKTQNVGINSGGYPVYTGDAGQVAAQPNWPNGILNSPSGNATHT